MTENEALKRFIPILGRISAPGERATITRNILERIAGRKTSVMGVSHKHAGALAWPNDHVKALAFEQALDIAVDDGEFVSTIHSADRRHFQIEELSAWPNCPKVDTESPLVFWLGDNAHTTDTPPAPVIKAPASETQEPVAPSQVLPRKTRSNLLTPLIEAAQRQSQDPTDTAAVWLVLNTQAERKVKPFVGVTESGLKWIDHNDDPQFLSLKNLRDRINRKQKKPR